MSNSITDNQKRTYFDCTKCPAFCCSTYERVEVGKRDLKRLAKYFQLSPEETAKRYTKMYNNERILRRKKDRILGMACQFLDQETRRWTIYEARPSPCRSFPGKQRCAYYDLLQFERDLQNEPDVVPIVQITFQKWRRPKRDAAE